MAEAPSHRDELLRVFKLEAEDIDANRTGALSARQQQQLAASGTRNLLAALVIGLALAAILAFVATKPLKPVQVILAGVLFLVVLIVGINDFRRTRAAGAEGRVETLTGPIQVRSRGKAGFYLTVSGRSFKLPVHFWKLHNGAAYRVYVSPRADRIVAMEPDEA